MKEWLIIFESQNGNMRIRGNRYYSGNLNRKILEKITRNLNLQFKPLLSLKEIQNPNPVVSIIITNVIRLK